MKLQHKNAIITGGSQGLGRAIVREYITNGANVLFCGRDAASLSQAEAELRPLLGPEQKLIALPCDVSKPDQVEALFAAADREIGALHILVNNAGIYGPKGPTDEVDLDKWIQSIEVNLYGTLLPCREAMRRFKKTSYGKIINLSGGGATNPMPRISSYAAAKAAVVRLTETLAEELREYRVDVNAVAPGALNTRLLQEVLEAGPENVGPEFYAKSLKQSESGGVPLDKGARLCVYLGMAASDGITGKLISAQWDPWENLETHFAELNRTDIYTLRRIVPKDRGQSWG